MTRIHDLVLLLVVLLSMLAGIVFPGFGSLFDSLPIYCLMILLFLSFLSIEVKTIWQTLKDSMPVIACLTFLKLAVLPVAVYFVFRAVAPAYADAALLLSGISTGVVAPFIATLVRGNSALVMVLVVVTSLLIPFSLPALIKALLGRSVEIPLAAMVRMLALVIFLPFVASEAVRILAPSFLRRIMKARYPLSLTLFAVVNLGVFSRYAAFFHREPLTILTATFIAFLLAAVYCAAGILCMYREPLENRIAGAVTLGNMNNVLIIVFAARFFGPLEPTVAALYIIPFFALIVPLRAYGNRFRGEGGLPARS